MMLGYPVGKCYLLTVDDLIGSQTIRALYASGPINSAGHILFVPDSFTFTFVTLVGTLWPPKW